MVSLPVRLEWRGPLRVVPGPRGDAGWTMLQFGHISEAVDWARGHVACLMPNQPPEVRAAVRVPR